jgi:hypothetical protein
MRRRLEQGGVAMFAKIFIPIKLRRAAARFFNDQSGAVLALVAILIIPVLIGFAALGIDIGSAFSRQRQMQVVADASAYSGAASLVQCYNVPGCNYYAQEAQYTAAAAGFASSGNIAVTPSLNTAGDTVTVNITELGNWALAGLFLASNSHSTAVQAVAKVDITNDYCIVALCSFNSPSTGVLFQGSAQLKSSNNCGVTSNCKTTCSVKQNGAAAEITVPVYSAGGFCANGNGATTVTDNAYLVKDPYASFETNLAGLSWPMSGAINMPNSGNVSPGVFNSFSPNGTVNLAPGTYYVDGDLKLNAGAIVNGNGVTIIVSPTSKVTINGGAQWNIDSGSLPANGVALAGYGTNIVSITGNLASAGRGAIYFPRAEVDYSGSSLTTTECLQIVANTVQLSGNSNLNDGCAASGNKVVNFKIRLIK